MIREKRDAERDLCERNRHVRPEVAPRLRNPEVVDIEPSVVQMEFVDSFGNRAIRISPLVSRSVGVSCFRYTARMKSKNATSPSWLFSS